MLIVKFWGGLGNQLFIYALYRALENQGKKVKADISNYGTVDIRDFLLEDLGITLDYATDADYFSLQKNIKDKLRFIKYKFQKREYKYFNSYAEQNKSFEKQVFEVDDTCLLGYWQNPEYFMNISDILRKEIKLTCSEKLNSLKESILSTNSVSVHVRLTDYLTLTTNGMGHVCNEEYYKEAIPLMLSKIDNPVLYIFSDDIELAKQMLSDFNNLDIHYIKPNDTIDDMYLMSLCKHHILANSSYSWWASFLSDQNGTFIAPELWSFSIPNWNINLSNWITIDNTSRWNTDGTQSVSDSANYSMK